MKKIVSLLVLTAVTSAYGQIQATPAPPATEAAPTQAIEATPAATAPAATTTATPAKAVSTSVTKKEKPKSPWSGSFLSEVSRGANINHSKVLDESAPDKRVESSLYFSGSIKYKASPKNSFSLNQRVAKDNVKNPASDEDIQWNVLNTRVGWTHATDITLLGSGAIAMPFGVELPTSKEARQPSSGAPGLLFGLRFTPVISWEFNPVFSLSLTSVTQLNVKNPQNEPIKSDVALEKSSLLLSNTLGLSANLTDTVSIYQNLGVTSSSSNARNPMAMDQTGAQMDVATGISWSPVAYLNFDASVGQSAPIQGNGYKSVTVYNDREYKLYHEAQTGYTLDITYTF